MRWRLVAIGLVVVGVAALVVVLRDGERRPPTPAGPVADAFAYDPERREQLERRAAAGLSHVLYARSPGGAIASAARTARWRPIVEQVAADADLEADTLEALVFLESAGRPDARASDDLEGAVGLTQILAETGRNLLGMRVDVRASERLTRGIARGRKVAARKRVRRRVDERFDPRRSLQATARYLTIAKQALGRDDLAVVSYHMGIGNLQRALSRYGDDEIPYAQLFFDSSPLRNEAAWDVLAGLGDDSSTYLWRLYAAREIMRLHREDPDELARRADLQTRKASAEELLHPPPQETEVFGDFEAIEDARSDGRLVALDPARLSRAGLRIDPRMGELAARLDQSPNLYRALHPQALATLQAIGVGVRAITGTRERLTVTSTVRDERYQQVLAARNIEATDAYSLHTTGWAFDISRRYRSRAQARALQFMLDRLTALNAIAWVREPAAIHVTAAAAGG